MDTRRGAGDLQLFSSLAQLLSQQGAGSKVTYCSARCLDQECQHRLYFPQHEASVECPNCGQRHSVVDLPDRKVLGEQDQRYALEVDQLRKMYSASRKTAEQVKVKGVSNLQCKLLSPLLTSYGMGKNDQPCTLEELGVGKIFDCSKLSNRSFAIEEAQLGVLGYGLDRSGSQAYLRDTLQQLCAVNGDEKRLVPLHADGDGHCLVHAISRCLVGRELFWHALRSNLHAHLISNLQRYQTLFKEFYSTEEWEGLVAEAAPDWKPPVGQTLGLCNIHVFALANVLHRPIILLDSLMGMQSSGDYSGIFLPTMLTPEECSFKDSQGEMKLNSPIVIAWSNSGRNHFIPLVPVKGKPLPKLPPHLQPKVWGSEAAELARYVSLDSEGCMEVCGGKELGERYLLRLIQCMDKLFLEKNKVVPSLVSDVDQYVYKVAGYVGVAADSVIASTRAAVEEGRLFRCLICSALSMVPADWLTKGGMLYQKAAESSIKLVDGVKLTFPFDGINASYSADTDSLTPLDVSCFHCISSTRQLTGDGSIVYKNGDRTQTLASQSRCGCGYKHYWDGVEYDNLPERIPLSLSWGGKTISVEVYWFQYESDPAHNSNVYQVASKAVADNFPGEFGSERLVQQAVDHILRVTENKEGMEQVSGHHPSQGEDHTPNERAGHTPNERAGHTPSEESPNQSSPVQPSESELGGVLASKIILTGNKARTLHKEELTMSKSEKAVKKKIEDNARVTQHKRKYSGSKSPPSSAKIMHTSKPLPSSSGSMKSSKSPPSAATIAKATSSKPAGKRIRVTSSDGQTCNLTLDSAVTYTELQEAIERELKIPVERQKLRSGFPPRELHPPSDPSQPVALVNGEKVSVDILPAPPSPSPPQSAGGEVAGQLNAAGGEQQQANQTQQVLNALLQQMLGKSVDLWSLAQHQPQLFRKGGDYYQQVITRYGSQLEDNTHLQFKELPNKTFAYNAATESLELCLGVQHIPVGPLSPQMEQMALLASDGKVMDRKESSGTEASSSTNSSSVSVRPGHHHVKAFSGRGRTLSSSSAPQQQQQQQDGLTQQATQLSNLKEQEFTLQQQVRVLNKKLVDAEKASATESTLETQLINTSSQLKKVRDKISELSRLT